jgi:hypothetical protein
LVDIIDTKKRTIQSNGDSVSVNLPIDWARICETAEPGVTVDVHLCHSDECGYQLTIATEGDQPRRDNQ